MRFRIEMASEMAEIVLPVLNRERVRAVDRLLVESYGIAPLQTMENVGRNLALVTKELLDGDLADRPLVVLAGRGSNGGGGLAAARHLLNWGAWVQILCSHPAEEYTGIAAHQLFTLQAMGAPLAWAEEGWELPPSDLVIDTVIGGGLRGEPQGKARDLIQLANSSMAPILSLEMPSGVDGDSGELFMPHVRAAATLTGALPKQGLLMAQARLACGHLYLGDSGVPLALYEELGLAVSPFFGRNPIVRWHVVDGMARVMDSV
jgi:NAD(P)H-hydrate epimerase